MDEMPKDVRVDHGAPQRQLLLRRGKAAIGSSRPPGLRTGYPFSLSWRVHAVHSRLGVVGAAIDYITYVPPLSFYTGAEPLRSTLVSRSSLKVGLIARTCRSDSLGVRARDLASLPRIG